MGLRFGLDIGIGSVGWAVVKEDYSVLELGSNIFPAADANGNVERRSFRQGRRLKRREEVRVSDFKKLWTNMGFKIPQNCVTDILALRVKSLGEKVSDDELYSMLLYMLKHRGISYLEDAIDDNTSGGSDYEKGLMINQKELQTKLPCEIQYERMMTYGKYRGDNALTDDKGEKLLLSNVFTTSGYRKEINKQLECQREFNKSITDDFIQKYLEIFDRKREYYVGPGNELSRTDYGRYTTKINPENGQYITEDNIFEKLIGKCSVYPDQMRAAGASYTAQEFNVLNDLNNLTINGRKLTKEEKEEIIRVIKVSNSVNMRKIIQKAIGENIDSFEGARIDKDEKEIFHEFKVYNKLRKELEKVGVDISEMPVEDLDKIGEILTLNTEKSSIVSAFEKNGIVLSQPVVECIINVRKKNGSLFNKWQSLSLMIMQELIPELYEQPKNQMQLLTDMGVFKTNSERFKEFNTIPKEIVTEELYNPVVRRSIRITVDIVNALIKKYGYPEQIVIEMPRDKNSDEEKKRVNDEQRKNEKELKDIISRISKEYSINITDEHFRKHKKLALKLKLWNEQEGICPYSGNPIHIDELLSNPDKFEVDHIIPKSISFDDSRTNKVLVLRSENQQKGNRTPYMYLSLLNRDWNYDKYMSYVLSLKSRKRINKAKADKLLNTQDITKIEVLKGFVARNINDTRYASRVILNTFQDYFKSKEASTKIKVIRGSFTHQMRVNMKLDKDREKSYSHHAVDAMLICYSQMGYDSYKNLQESFIDFETGEITDESLWNKNMTDEKYDELLYQNKWKQIKDNIINEEKNVKYWYKVDRKCNRSLCNQTIRGTRVVDGKTIKINKINIMTDDGYKKFVDKIEGGKEDIFLMYKKDPKTFENLVLVYNEYKDAKNAFVEYEKATGDYVRKYSKKNNGPRIEVLKYTDGEVISCIDISHKYGHEKGSKKVILESLKPYRTDVYYNKSTGLYYLIGLKYSDIKCDKGMYVIDEAAYARILREEKLINEGENRYNLLEKGYEFLFSLHKNDIIRYESAGKVYTERFLSRTMPQARNYIETKPVDMANFAKRNPVGLSKCRMIIKISTDILGNQYYINREKFSVRVDNL